MGSVIASLRLPPSRSRWLLGAHAGSILPRMVGRDGVTHPAIARQQAESHASPHFMAPATDVRFTSHNVRRPGLPQLAWRRGRAEHVVIPHQERRRPGAPVIASRRRPTFSLHIDVTLRAARQRCKEVANAETLEGDTTMATRARAHVDRWARSLRSSRFQHIDDDGFEVLA